MECVYDARKQGFEGAVMADHGLQVTNRSDSGVSVSQPAVHEQEVGLATERA